MKIFVLLVFMLILQSCQQQKSPEQSLSIKKRVFYNKDFKWEIAIPENFEEVSAAEREKKQEMGANKLKDNYGDNVEFKGNNIFLFKNEQANYLEALYEPFSSSDRDYSRSFKDVNKMIYETLKNPAVSKLDSSSTLEVIDGLKFYTFKIGVDYQNKTTMHWCIYSRLFDKKAFTVNIITIDTAKERILLDSWRNSKFGHNQKIN
ncbi:hypothetical protein GCM10022289_38470 [Pedobacter jeongneungensis]|uniref:Lipoprotein n=1 Tax=Pedobacter jeongneungensis TaxID=947309 RepID=A0ABP8BMR7_9SPHI